MLGWTHSPCTRILQPQRRCVRRSQRIAFDIAVRYDVTIAPFAGARIETSSRAKGPRSPRSPPSRGRGLKLLPDHHRDAQDGIAPFAGARIETASPARKNREDSIAPFAGARIETRSRAAGPRSPRSPPSRGRGLKRVDLDAEDAARLSPPSRGRGLKRVDRRDQVRHRHRPLRGGAD